MNAGMKRGRCVELLGLTRHQLYYKSNGRRVGAQKTMDTLKLIDEAGNKELVQEQVIVKEIITTTESKQQIRFNKEVKEVSNWVMRA